MKKIVTLMVVLGVLIASTIWAETAKSIWTGKSGGFEFQWTTDDIRITPESDPSMIILSYKKLFQGNFGSTSPKTGYALQYVRMVSLVGPVMSGEQYTEGSSRGAAHPFSDSRFNTIDLRHPNRMARLTDYFQPRDIYKALLRDKIVQKHLGGDAPAETLDRLITQLVEHGGGPDEVCEHGFESDFLDGFAFYEIKDNKVAVRLGLSNVYGTCRGSFAQLGIWLPIPEKLHQDLSDAASHTSGFLMKEQNIAKPLYLSIVNPSKTFLQNVTQFEIGDIDHIQNYR